MPLLDKNMLPKLVRTMEPMGDLFQAEQVVLDLLELYIQQLLVDAGVNNNTPATVEELKKFIARLTGFESKIAEKPERLEVKILFLIKDFIPDNSYQMQKRIENYMPAHLKIIYEYMAIQKNRTKIMFGSVRDECVSLSFKALPNDRNITRRIFLNFTVATLNYVSVSFPAERSI